MSTKTCRLPAKWSPSESVCLLSVQGSDRDTSSSPMTEAMETPLTLSASTTRKNSLSLNSSTSSRSSWESLSTIYPDWNDAPRPSFTDITTTSLGKPTLETSFQILGKDFGRRRGYSTTSIRSAPSLASLSPIDSKFHKPWSSLPTFSTPSDSYSITTPRTSTVPKELEEDVVPLELMMEPTV